MESVSANNVKVALRKKGIMPTEVKKNTGGLFGGDKKIKDTDIVMLIRQLSTLINAGVPLIESVSMLASATHNSGMRKMMVGVEKTLNEGQPLSEALSKYPKYFDYLFINMVIAGEQGGILDTIFMRLAEFREKSSALKKKVRSAMFYPAAIIIVMFIVIVILMVVVIPKIAGLYKSFGANLPTITVVVIDISDFMVANWWIIFAVPVGLVYGYLYGYRHSKKFRYLADKINLKLPIIGTRVLLAGAVSRFFRTLASMQSAGVPLQEALESLKSVSGNVLISDSIEYAREEVLKGNGMAQALGASGVMPKMAINMLRIGEGTGSIEIMANKIAEFYENEGNETVERMNTLMEPVIMVVLGLIVGVLIVAMYLPILRMGSVVTHGS
jgi:type IV pilus assembly protein PilC